MSKILYAAGTMSHINNFHLDYIDALRRDGHEVLVMAKGKGADFDIAFEKRMVTLKNIACRRKIRKILKEEKFDTVILNTTLAAFNIRRALPKKRRPRVINIVHGYMFHTEPKGIKEKIFLFCEKLLKKKTDAIMVMNSEDFESTRRYELCLGEAVMTLGMGAEVGESRVDGEIFSKYTDSEGKYVICFVGELCKAKAQHVLICAFPEIKMAIPNAVLWLIGDGNAREELSSLAEKLNISDSVCFMGVKSNPCDFIRSSDVYVSASEKEGLPFNIMEALGCGKPIVASDVKGHRDLIEDGKSGFLFPVGDISELVRLVLAIHSGEVKIDPEEAKKRYVVYSKENVFDKTYNTLKELMEK